MTQEIRTKFFIITGLSGAGKSQALKILEDLGFFCVDNLPIELVPRFADLCREIGGKMRNVALGIDIRAGKSIASLDNILAEIQKRKIKYRIIFFTANDATLLQRYSETRRRHPLGKRVLDGIRKERKMMADVLSIADQEIDTSYLTIGELKEILAREMEVPSGKKMTISLMSFGYKYGLPIDADLVIDVRFLPNPNYVHSLRAKTGQDTAVKRYVKRQKLYREFYAQFSRLIDFLLPNYIREGKSYLTLAVGCTGGRHRSVFIAEALAQHLRRKKYPVQIYHRDIEHGV
jgi:RNase adapter protein RapZ